MNDKIAVVLDISGSMKGWLDHYLLDQSLKIIDWEAGGGCDPSKLGELAKKYRKVYFFTDGIFAANWELILAPNVIVINVIK